MHRDTPSFQLAPEPVDPDAEDNLDPINAWILESNRDRSRSDICGGWQGL